MIYSTNQKKINNKKVIFKYFSYIRPENCTEMQATSFELLASTEIESFFWHERG
jgi:hypothetical protein